MKQYTTNEQTAKLIKLGFKKPNGWYVDGVMNNVKLYVNIDENPMMFNYSIGELIEMLPRTIKNYYDLNIFSTSQGWWVLYGMIGDGDMWSVEYELYRKELIDALYAMIVKLKEEGVI